VPNFGDRKDRYQVHKYDKEVKEFTSAMRAQCCLSLNLAAQYYESHDVVAIATSDGDMHKSMSSVCLHAQELDIW
jgi:hypothetical protein